MGAGGGGVRLSLFEEAKDDTRGRVETHTRECRGMS